MRVHPLLITLAFAASTMLASPVLAAPDDLSHGIAWRSIGPAVSGGRAGAVAGTDADPSLYYAGAAGGGLWKTVNAGGTWTPVFDAQDVASIGAVTIDPQDEQTVWVGTGESNPRNDVTQGDGVYKTVDGGAHWTHVLSLKNSLIGRIVVDPRDARRVVVAVLGDPFADSPERGIYRTTDGGSTWTKTLYLGPSSGASDLIANPQDPNVLYAGMWQYRRTAWSSQSGGPDDGLFRSTDGGATWTRLSGHGLPSEEEGRIGLAISRSNPQRVYALIETKHGLLWRSDDGGANWALVSSDPLLDERPFYYSTIFADPRNADRLWAETVHMTVSTDGGKTFAITGRGVHGDHHEMWIAADGKRIIEGNDGGIAFSYDAGATWQWNKSLPISQLYHASVSRGLAYSVCAGLQDNGNWCGAAVPLQPSVSSSDWKRVGDGDGTWTLFDPRNQQLIWQADAGGDFAGDVSIHNLRTGETREVGPYLRDQNVIDPKDLGYRFNWETPIAFDPFDPTVAYTAANVVFASRDGGAHWTKISPDLTRNLLDHETVSGGITLDGTGAETSETILALAPSHAARGLIWVGTDDGVIALTRDGGAHWTRVTPAGIAPLGRFAAISPSANDPSVAYAVYDRHMVGDRRPYVFMTRDYGAHWNSIAAGLPEDDEARTILADPKTPHLLYLGLERSLYASWNDGTTWEKLSANLPPVSVREIVLQPDTSDLVLATHGRGVWILDDATVLQQLAHARASHTYLFPVRDGIEWNVANYFGTRPDGAAPNYGATVSYYLAAPAASSPTLDIVDANGAVVRRYSTKLPNAAGINRFVWDLASENAREWKFAPDWNRGTLSDGAPVVPGSYTVRLHVEGKTYTQSIVVRQDPRTHYTLAQLAEHHDRVQRLIDAYSQIDDALNLLSTVAQEAPLRAARLNASGHASLAQSVDQIGTNAKTLIAGMTSNPQNDQDNDFLPDVLRERMQSEIATYAESSAPATAAQIEEDDALLGLTRRSLAALDGFSKRADSLDADLEGLHLPSLRIATVRVHPHGETGEDVDRR